MRSIRHHDRTQTASMMEELQVLMRSNAERDSVSA